MHTIFAKQLPTGFDLFRNDQLLGVLKNERELVSRLYCHGIHGRFLQDFLRKLKETGSATEEMPDFAASQLGPIVLGL